MTLKKILGVYLRRLSSGREEFVILPPERTELDEIEGKTPGLREHAHLHIEFCSAIRGRFSIIRYGERRDFSAGETLIFPPGSSHLERPTRAKNHYDLLWGDVSPKRPSVFSTRYRRGDFFELRAGVCWLGGGAILSGMRAELASALRERDGDIRRAELTGVLMVIAAGGLRALRKSHGEGEWGLRIIEEAEGYVEKNLAEPLTLSEISASVNLSPCYLSSLYKKLRGENLFDYINARRIAKACDLLADPRRSIKEVSSLVGFEDPYYFSKVFKKLRGAPPKVYRNRN